MVETSHNHDVINDIVFSFININVGKFFKFIGDDRNNNRFAVDSFSVVETSHNDDAVSDFVFSVIVGARNISSKFIDDDRNNNRFTVDTINFFSVVETSHNEITNGFTIYSNAYASL